MANNDNEKNKNKSRSQLIKLNNLFKSGMKSINSNIYSNSTENDDEISKLNKSVNDIITDEINGIKSITTDEMSTFLVKLFNNVDDTSKYNQINNLDDVFGNESAGLFQFFQQRYQNQNLMYEDLNIICSQLYELEEAIMTTRDSIVTSDDITNTISRTLKFKHNQDDDEQKLASYTESIKELEKSTSILKKIKNQIIPSTLKYGEYYVYICPYSVLFQEQYNKKVVDPSMNGVKISESVDINFAKDLIKDIDSLSTQDTKIKVGVNVNETLKSIESYTEHISIENTCCSIPLLEGVDLSELVDAVKFNSTAKKYVDNPSPTSTDGTKDINELSNKDKHAFDNETGCYIKYIDPRRIIPIKILDKTIGYYYIHGTDFQVNKSPFSSTIRVSSVSGTPYQNVDDVESMFLSKITDKIIKAFDKPFLEKNAKFKDLILNALLYNDFYRKEIKFQFIPAEYIVEFKVNEDDDGNGQSALSKALFYGKLYLALLVFKMISIITKSNDTRVYYVKNSGIDQNVTNKVQEVARSIKGRQINFMDLLNYNSIISKIGAYKEVFIPVGRTGDRGIEFDILSGQDVPLNTDLMELLHTNMVSATGVPSVIMNYINEADYAKTLVMANSKFASRVVSYQLDFNEPITKMYKMLIKYSNINIPDNFVDAFEFAFNTPRTLNTNNTSDQLSATEQVISAVIKALTGENAEQNNENNILKDKIYNKLFRLYMPGIDWNSADTIYANSKIELAEDLMKNEAIKNKDESSNDESSY